MLFIHLLVPTDFSEAARHEASWHHARATLLHVLPPDTRPDIHYLAHAPKPPPQESLNPLGGSEAGVPLAEITTGHAADTIVRIAQWRNADLIVAVPTAARGSRKMLLLQWQDKEDVIVWPPELTPRSDGRQPWAGRVTP